MLERKSLTTFVFLGHPEFMLPVTLEKGKKKQEGEQSPFSLVLKQVRDYTTRVPGPGGNADFL